MAHPSRTVPAFLLAGSAPRLLLASLFLSTLALPAVAQDYRDLTTTRNRKQHYSSLLQIRAGYRMEQPDHANLATGSEEDEAVDGFLFYHSEDFFTGEAWHLDVYAGQDGAYIGLKDTPSRGKATQSRLELFGRPKAFFREGYYANDQYLTTGQYEGTDYTFRISTAQPLESGLILDIGAFYRDQSFDTNAQTPPALQYDIPDNFAAYGVSIIIEQNTVTHDPKLGLPITGFMLTGAIENERNNSDKNFGSAAYTSTLPSSMYRLDVNFESYYANGASACWVTKLIGGYYDPRDRITSYQAEHVQGHIWGDLTLGYRMTFGDSLVLKPYVQAQYAKILQQDGIESDEETFFGGGLDLSLIFSDNLALVMRYSYVDNPSRAPVGLNDDLYGEHQLFIGLDAFFGSGRSR